MAEGQQSARAEPSAQTAAPSANSGRDHMWHYVCQMSALHPEVIHPERDWIDNNLRDAGPVARGGSGPEEGGVTLASLKALIEGQAAEITSLKEHNAQSETAFSSFRQRNTLTELRLRQDGLSGREKEKRHRMMAYSNIMLKSHASNLFDIESTLSDVLGSAGSAVPEIAARLRHAAATESEHMDEGLPQCRRDMSLWQN